MTEAEDRYGDMRRVLLALRAEAGKQDPGTPLRLRDIANRILAGDTQRAAAVLADLDADGYVRTVTMGWYLGWLTAKGKDSDPQAGESC
jgi:hypothetical protein